MVENARRPQPEPHAVPPGPAAPTGKVDSRLPESHQKAPLPNRTTPEQKQLQFTLRDMLLGITALAVVLALCSQLGNSGAVLVWFLAVVATGVSFVVRSRLMQPMRIMVWGVLMPLICLDFDPIFFGDGLLMPNSPSAGMQRYPADMGLVIFQYFAYSLLLYQMLAILVWVIRGPRGPREAAVMNGTLAVGFVIACCVAMPCAFLGWIGLLIGEAIALLSTTPLLTAWVFWITSGAAGSRAEAGLGKALRRQWSAVGIGASLALPALGAVVLYAILAALGPVIS